MPTRYLRPGICDSDAIDSLSPLAEVFFYRLLVNVDDFGRLDARLPILKARCFPIKDSIDPKKIDSLLRELHEKSLLIAYFKEGKPFLQLKKWDNKPRADASKFPEFSDECIQMYTDVNMEHTNLPLTVTVTGTVYASSEDDGFDSFWSIYPRKEGKQKAIQAWRKLKPDFPLREKIAESVKRQSRTEQWLKGIIPHASTYLNGGRWDDEPVRPGVDSRSFRERVGL